MMIIVANDFKNTAFSNEHTQLEKQDKRTNVISEFQHGTSEHGHEPKNQKKKVEK